jgi:hypothetical protein
MKGVTEARGLGDLRTATSHHITAMPSLKGTAHLDLYLLDMERQRLEKELSCVEMRRRRINSRLEEIKKNMERLNDTAAQGHSLHSLLNSHSTERAAGKQGATAKRDGHGKCKMMSVEY